MLRAILVDDEEIGRETLAQLIKDYCYESVEIIGQAHNVTVAYQTIIELKPDVVFLDIEMYGENGFDLLNKFDEINFDVVFTTAYSSYSIKAIQYSAFGYLLKPVSITELQDVVTKLKKKTASNQLKLQYSNLLQNLRDKGSNPKIAIPDSKGFSFIDINKIMHCEAKGNYTIINIEGAEAILSSRSLKDYEELLGESDFLRIHNCHLVNLNYLKRYDKGDRSVVILKNDSEIEVSRRRKLDLMQRISNIKGII